MALQRWANEMMKEQPWNGVGSFRASPAGAKKGEYVEGGEVRSDKAVEGSN